MPELPEVETVKRRLTPSVVGKTIKSVEVFYNKYDCLNVISNEKIESIERKGKFLIFNLSNHRMISHLRMEGKYRIENINPIKSKHDLVFFHLDDSTLVYNDVRKFGVFYVFDKDTDVYKEEPLINVGEEPFTATKEYLLNKLKGKTGHIKSLLLDQSILSGLGNIYVDEVLFMSKINPFKKGSDIKEEEADRIINNSVIVLNKAINAGGTTIRSFESFNGEAGHFQGSLLIHEREGERCYNCGNFVLKTKCNGRGTYYCPTCQRSHEYKTYAITGGFASGKSTVMSYIKELGYETYSTDEIYNELFASLKPMQREIFSLFKTLDKSKLREIVYNDSNRNNELKRITHKYVIEELFRRIEENPKDIFFIEVPLLYEGNLEKCFDHTIDVHEGDNVRNLILEKRNISLDFYKLVSSKQMNIEDKKNNSEYVIENNGSLDSLKEKTSKLLKKILN